MEKLRVFEAFAGVGSQRMALRNLGIDPEVVAIAEIDKYAIQSYEAIHGPVNNVGDISKLSIDDIPDHDLFTYSFPCQDISIAGQKNGLQEGSGTRSSLLWECKRVIEGKKPKYLLLENVKNLLSSKNKPNFEKWLEWLESQGYSNYWQVVNAKDATIPQNRERLFVVSVLGNELYSFPQSLPQTKCIADCLEEVVDSKYYRYQHVIDTYSHKPSQKHGKPNEVWRVGLYSYYNFDTLNRVYDIRGIASCLTTKYDRITILTEQGHRYLTPLEFWLLMGFSKTDFKKAKASGVTDNELYKQAGNSIVVPVLEGIFRNLFLKEEAK